MPRRLKRTDRYASDSFGNWLHQAFSDAAASDPLTCNITTAPVHGKIDLFYDGVTATAGTNRISHGSYGNAQGNFIFFRAFASKADTLGYDLCRP